MLEFLWSTSSKPARGGDPEAEQPLAAAAEQPPPPEAGAEAPPAGEGSAGATAPAGEPPPAEAAGGGDLPSAFALARRTGRRRGRRLVPPAAPAPPLTAEQRLLLLDTWQRSGLPAADFAALVGLSRYTLYTWKKKFAEHGPADLLDQPRGGARGSQLPDGTGRVPVLPLPLHSAGRQYQPITSPLLSRRARDPLRLPPVPDRAAIP
jgi:hypothetical protein